MPKFKHTVESEYTPTFRSEKIVGMFDVPIEDKLRLEWDVDMPIEEEEWQIGLIVGPSGAGKTTLAKVAFGAENYHEGYEWSGKHVVDDFPKGMSADEITRALSHVGFSSPPAWLRPYHVLSNGQKFRADIARTLLDPDKELIVYDEFTSVVDRTVAQMGSEAVQKYIRKSGKKFVAVSCHYDIIPWLRPDWVYQVDTGSFEWTRGRLRRPELRLKIQRVHHSAWRIFRGHHYLSADINTASHCYVGMINDEPVCFTAVIYQPHKKQGGDPNMPDIYREHRTVVLPDYQGIGIGNKMSDRIAQHYKSMGHRYRSVTSHPAFFFSRMHNPNWVLTRAPGRVPPRGGNSTITGQSSSRVTAAFEYVGENNDTD